MNKKQIVHACNVWACEFVRSEESSILGYQSKSAEQSIVVDGGKLPDFHPEVRMSRDSRAVDRAVREMPKLMREAIVACHIATGTTEENAKAWCERHKVGRRKFWTTLDSAYWYIAPFIRGSV